MLKELFYFGAGVYVGGAFEMIGKPFAYQTNIFIERSMEKIKKLSDKFDKWNP